MQDYEGVSLAMKAAAKSVDITPPVGLPIGGNVRQDNISRGIHDSLYCNILILEDGKNKVCFLNVDLIGLHYESCQLIKNAVYKKTGIKPEGIVIFATHTHSGPDVVEFFKESIDPACIEYINTLAEKISDEVAEIYMNTNEANVAISKYFVNDLSFNRRLISRDGNIIMNWEYPDEKDILGEAGPIDEELYAISIIDESDKLISLLINFTLHPAVLVGQDWLWSRDYIHYLDVFLKNHLSSDFVLLFANGAEGNINHINYRDKNQKRGFLEAQRIGEKLGQYVLDALKISKTLEDIDLVCISEKAEFPLRNISDTEIKEAEKLLIACNGVIPSLLDGCPEEMYAKEKIKLSRKKEKFATTELQLIKLSSDVIIVTFPGEVFVEIGLEVKKTSGYENTLIFGLANDCIGYIPTAEAFEQKGGYETKTAASSKLDPSADEILINSIRQLLKRL